MSASEREYSGLGFSMVPSKDYSFFTSLYSLLKEPIPHMTAMVRLVNYGLTVPWFMLWSLSLLISRLPTLLALIPSGALSSYSSL